MGFQFTRKKDFEKFFRQEVLPAIREKEKEINKRGHMDVYSRREAWNNLVDSMERAGELPHHAIEWDPPW